MYYFPICRSFGGTIGHEASVISCTFSPDGSLLVSGSPTGDLRIWDACYGHSKNLTSALEAHDLGVTACEFSPTYGSAGNTEYLITSACSYVYVFGKSTNVK